METLDCMSSGTCPSCWHFQAGRCVLTGALNTALVPAREVGFAETGPMYAQGPLTDLLSLGSASA